MRRETKEKKLKKFTSKMQAKLLLVFCIIVAAMLGLVGRLVYLNDKDGDRYSKRVLSQQTYSNSVVPYKRGSIYDRKGTVLAVSDKVYNVILDVKQMLSDEGKYRNATTKALTDCYSAITEETLKDIIKNKPESRYVILKKGLSYDEMMKFKNKEKKDQDIQGVWFEEDYVRNYPYNTLACDVIGFTSNGNVGNWGIEQYYNNELNGTNGREYGYMDNELNLQRTVKPAIDGNSIVSTIDANVQGIVQDQIKKFNNEFGSKNIGVLIMNPNTGEILAMASNEEYNLNDPTDLTSFYTKQEISKMSEKQKMNALNAIWRNFTISDTYEPGSTFKPFTIAAALEENIIHPNATYYCDGGETVGGYRIKCSKRTGHGEITLTQALEYSCNDALMQIAFKEGKKLFSDYQSFFGFGTKSGIDLPGEASGILINENNMIQIDLATSSFGQTFTTTMVQLASGFSSLINGGNFYQPHIVKQIVDEDGNQVKNYDKVLVKKTVSRETSEFLKNALYLTVEEGTAKGAQVPGYKVGGKTGTAQKYPRSAGTYLVSFIGIVPTDNPQIVIYVVVDEPQNVVKQADSSIATKLTSKILKEVLPLLEIYPTEESSENTSETETIETVEDPALPSPNDNTAEENTSEENSVESEDYEDLIPENTTEESKLDKILGDNTLEETTEEQ